MAAPHLLRLALAAAIGLAAGPAAACLVCIALPERTIADRLLDADAVVLATADPARPFAYRPATVLKGHPAGPIPHLVDSPTRRRLADDPSAAVLFAHAPEDGWTPLAYADADVRAMAGEILAAGPAWRVADDLAARFAYFAARHDHPNATVRRLALAEMLRAPYALIRTVTPRLPRSEIARVLRDPQWIEWAPIHILFLGLSTDPADQSLVRRALETASRQRTDIHLAAWATAYAEIEGPNGVDRLRALYFDDPARGPDEVRVVVTAFATLRDGGDPALAPRIDAAFRALAHAPPALAAEAAKQFLFAQDWSQAPAFADLLASGALADPAAEYVVSLYLEAAGDALRTPDPSTEWSLE